VADPEANVIYGIVTDESMGDAVKVTVIATGFKSARPQGLADAGRPRNYVGPRPSRPRRHRRAASISRPNAKAASGGGPWTWTSRPPAHAGGQGAQ
jgi:cell division protein FtsZ